MTFPATGDDVNDHATSVYWRPGCGFCSSLLRAVAAERPEELPDGYEPPEPSGFGRALTRLLGG